MIEVFADISCPFTHVGLLRLIEQRERLGRHDVVVRVRAWPLELVNDEPLDGDFVGEEIVALRNVVAPDLFREFDPTQFPTTTIPALALAAAAYRESDELGERVSLALRAALFEAGRDIGDPAELTAIANTAGMHALDLGDEQSVRDEWNEGKRRGVLGSPHFFVDDHDFFCPTLKITRVDDHLSVEVDLDAFSTFLATVFGDS